MKYLLSGKSKKFWALISLSILFALVLACFVPKNTTFAGTNAIYYVSPSGSDSNPGTLDKPWKTLGKAAASLNAGDTVYLRGGVYKESVDFSRSGTSSAKISVLAYPGETPILDGNNYTIPSLAWGPLLKVSGSYVVLSGLEVRYSKGMGVALVGANNQASQINSHHNKENGILITGDYGVVTDSVVWSNCMSNLDGGSSTGWASGLSAARDPINAVISNNVVYGNWGEGVSSYEADGTVIKNNEVYDNWSANIYVSDVTNILIQGNLVYQTGTMTSGSKVGIMMGDEKYNPPSSNIQVLDNIAYGNHRNYFWWQGTQGGGMNNVLIANNTFVNGTGNVNNGEGNVIIGKGTHINVRFMNNLVSQDSSLPVIATISQSGITYSNNLWSKTPYAAASGTGDVIGDPLLAKTDNPYSAEWYRLTELSPAIDKAKLLSAVTIDFFGLTRGDSPDIGAVEFTTITGGCE